MKIQLKAGHLRDEDCYKEKEVGLREPVKACSGKGARSNMEGLCRGYEAGSVCSD